MRFRRNLPGCPEFCITQAPLVFLFIDKFLQSLNE